MTPPYKSLTLKGVSKASIAFTLSIFLIASITGCAKIGKSGFTCIEQGGKIVRVIRHHPERPLKFEGRNEYFDKWNTSSHLALSLAAKEADHSAGSTSKLVMTFDGDKNISCFPCTADESGYLLNSVDLPVSSFTGERCSTTIAERLRQSGADGRLFPSDEIEYIVDSSVFERSSVGKQIEREPVRSLKIRDSNELIEATRILDRWCIEVQKGVFVRAGLASRRAQIDYLLNRKFDSNDIRILSFVDEQMDFLASQLFDQLPSMNKIRQKSDELEHLAEVLESNKNKLVLVLGHIEDGKFITDRETKRGIPLSALQKLAKERNINFFPLGCKSSMHASIGTGENLRSLKVMKGIEDGITKSKTYGDFFRHLGQDEYSFILNEYVFDPVTDREILEVAVYLNLRQLSRRQLTKSVFVSPVKPPENDGDAEVRIVLARRTDFYECTESGANTFLKWIFGCFASAFNWLQEVASAIFQWITDAFSMVVIFLGTAVFNTIMFFVGLGILGLFLPGTWKKDEKKCDEVTLRSEDTNTKGFLRRISIDSENYWVIDCHNGDFSDSKNVNVYLDEDDSKELIPISDPTKIDFIVAMINGKRNFNGNNNLESNFLFEGTDKLTEGLCTRNSMSVEREQVKELIDKSNMFDSDLFLFEIQRDIDGNEIKIDEETEFVLEIKDSDSLILKTTSDVSIEGNYEEIVVDNKRYLTFLQKDISLRGGIIPFFFIFQVNADFHSSNQTLKPVVGKEASRVMRALSKRDR